MEKILLLDTSIASANRGDDIIMECVRKELSPILKDHFVRTLPTHVAPFHWYQVWRNSFAVQRFADSKLKFVGGTNLLVPNMLTHYPQWNINLFNYKPLMGAVLVGVGAGYGAEKGSNGYTRFLYRKLLSHDYYHSVRDERTKVYLESLGLKAINTGCVTMWMFTPEFCNTIPTSKADKVVCTINHHNKTDERDQYIIDTLLRNYKEVYYWPQFLEDYDYLHRFKHVEKIHILQATKEDYDRFLTENDCDYVGTRLHGGIYALRHGRRSIIISFDERARAIDEANHLNCVDKDNLEELEAKINSEFATEVKMDFEAINRWKLQFDNVV